MNLDESVLLAQLAEALGMAEQTRMRSAQLRPRAKRLRGEMQRRSAVLEATARRAMAQVALVRTALRRGA